MSTVKIAKPRAEFLIGVGRSLLGQLASNAAPLGLQDVRMLRELADEIESQLKKSAGEKNLTLTDRQAEVIESALYFYERELLHNSPYNNMTANEQAAERRVVLNVRDKLDEVKR